MLETKVKRRKGKSQKNSQKDFEQGRKKDYKTFFQKFTKWFRYLDTYCYGITCQLLFGIYHESWT